MEPSRAQKSRSLGVENKTSRENTSAKRPQLSSRHNSAPLLARGGRVESSQALRRTKPSQVSRGSETSFEDDSLLESGEGSPALGAVDGQSKGLKASRVTANTTLPSEDVQIINIAVIGNEEVGKSCFIRNALELASPSTGHISSSKVALGGIIYRVQTIELSLDELDFVPPRHVSWPSAVGGVALPSIDGVLCLYDVTDEESIAGVPQLLSVFNKSETPCALVSCKSDLPEQDHELDFTFTNRVQKSFENIVVCEAPITDPQEAKKSLLRVLKSVLAMSSAPGRGSARVSATSSRATSLARERTSSRASPASRSRSRSTYHNSASQSRERPVPRPRSPVADPEHSLMSPTDRLPLNLSTTNLSRHQKDPQTPISLIEPSSHRPPSPSTRVAATTPETPESYRQVTHVRPGTADTSDGHDPQTFLHTDDESVCGSSSKETANMASHAQQSDSEGSQPAEKGASFAELVDRLLAVPTTKTELKFVPSFLCLYRAFATPSQLLAAILQRFVRTEKSDSTQKDKFTDMLRYLSVLAAWTARYPGDFANQSLRDVVRTFVKSIDASKTFAPAGKEISANMLTFVEDEDDDWAYGSSASRESRSTGSLRKRDKASATSLTHTADLPSKGTGISHNGEVGSDSESEEDDKGETPSSISRSGTTSSSSSILRVGNTSSQSAINLLALEGAREKARRLLCVPHIKLCKTQWHQFMETPTEDLAREITRINWTLYAAIRPRDFVRHVSLSSSKRTQSNKGDNIKNMEKHFNHLAYFVSGMILLRDKSKHRAKILEKMMDLAWKVRQMNNYQSLGAIVAGMDGEEIVRLSQTQELVPTEAQKQFMRLRILMGYQRSNAAYRLAWENSSSERIPFVPVVKQDLMKADSGNPTFLNNNVNWAKFEIMGETILGVQKSQEQAYAFPERTQKSQEVTRLLLETRVLNGSEDSVDPRSELWDRSKQVEPAAGGEHKKKFDWLRR